MIGLQPATPGVLSPVPDVAAATGIAPRTLARIERGARKPTWPMLERLCDEFGVSAFGLARTGAAQSMDLPPSPDSAPSLALRAQAREGHVAGVGEFERACLSAFAASAGPGNG